MSLRPKKDVIKIWNNCSHNQTKIAAITEELNKALELEKHSLKLAYHQHESENQRFLPNTVDCKCQLKDMKRKSNRSTKSQSEQITVNKTDETSNDEKISLDVSGKDWADYSDEDCENEEQDKSSNDNLKNNPSERTQSEDSDSKCWGDYSEDEDNEVDDQRSESDLQQHDGSKYIEEDENLRRRVVTNSNNNWQQRGSRRSINVRNSDDSIGANTNSSPNFSTGRNDRGNASSKTGKNNSNHRKSNSYSLDFTQSVSSPTIHSPTNSRKFVNKANNSSQSRNSGINRNSKGNSSYQQHRRSSSSNNDPPFIVLRRQLGPSPSISPAISPVSSPREVSSGLSCAAAAWGHSSLPNIQIADDSGQKPFLPSGRPTSAISSIITQQMDKINQIPNKEQEINKEVETKQSVQILKQVKETNSNTSKKSASETNNNLPNSNIGQQVAKVTVIESSSQQGNTKQINKQKQTKSLTIKQTKSKQKATIINETPSHKFYSTKAFYVILVLVVAVCALVLFYGVSDS